MKLKKRLITLALTIVVLLLGGCEFAIFSSEGYIGQEISKFIYITVGLMLLVVIPTLGMIVWMALRYRVGKNNPESDYEPEWEHSNKVEFWSWTVPIVIICILASITYYASHHLDPRKKIESENETMTIQVVSMDWKWLFIYPEEGIATINEIAVPIDTPVEFLITSNSTINSFWIPKLGGQLYAMAGMENRLNLIANQRGVYEGISNNYSGFGFSGMRFKVHSLPNAEYNDWIKKVQSSPRALDKDSFRELEKQSRDNEIEYYGKINPLQFKEIIEKFRGVQ